MQKSQPILSNDFSPAFALKNMTKDLGLIQKEGMSFPLFSPLLATYQAAARMGYGEDDAISIIRILDKNKLDTKGADCLNETISNSANTQKPEVPKEPVVVGH
jgi:hypothetical protein